MSRKFFAVVLAGFLLVAGAACGSDKLEADFVADCNEQLEVVQTGLVAISDGVDYIPTASPSQVREFLSTARSFVQTSIDTVNHCAKIDPKSAAVVLDSLNDLDDAIAEAQRSY